VLASVVRWMMMVAMTLPNAARPVPLATTLVRVAA